MASTSVVSKEEENKFEKSVTEALSAGSETPPRAGSRPGAHHNIISSLKKKHPSFLPILSSGFYLLILFLAILSYFYGSLFRVSERAHNLHVLAIDYDNDLVGDSLQKAYMSMVGPQFISLDFEPASSYPDPAAIDQALCGTKYWGAIYTQAGTSARLLGQISGNNTSNSNTNSFVIVYNGIHYPVIGESYIVSNLQKLAAVTSRIHFLDNAASYVVAANLSNPSSLAALLTPLSALPRVLFPTPNGNIVLLNTITMVIPPLMQFFFIMALDHIMTATRTFHRSTKVHVYLVRLLISAIYAAGGSLVVTGCIWGFKEDWDLNGAQFMETWLCFWFYMDICYLVMDSVVGTIVPLRFVPFFVFTWVILNVTSTLFPFELNPGFYRWAYALPAHEFWSLLMHIWSRGCVSKLDVALPVLFAWWLVGHVTSAIAVSRRCKAAKKQERGMN